MAGWMRIPAPVGGGTGTWWSGADLGDEEDGPAAIAALEAGEAAAKAAIRARAAPKPAGVATAAARARSDDVGDDTVEDPDSHNAEHADDGDVGSEDAEVMMDGDFIDDEEMEEEDDDDDGGDLADYL